MQMTAVGNTKQRSAFTRREFLVGGGAALSVAGAGLAMRRNVIAARRRPNVIVLGIDGMDPRLVARFVQEGRMPNAKRLIGTGTFCPLGTSVPPQSPIAWSSFISGANPGVHGIYDFIHREPATLKPYLSTSRTLPPGKTIDFKGWTFPLSGGQAELLRKGPTFWLNLEEHGVDCTIVKIPANYPPTPCRSRTLSGLSTPDVLGTYGTFTYVTSDPLEVRDDVGGGRIVQAYLENGKTEIELEGPPNTYREDKRYTRVTLTIFCDRTNPAATISVQGHEILLKEGEWSDWVRVRFEVIPRLRKLSGICRLYLKSVHPHLRLYVSPINIDPVYPALPISTPDGYARELAQNAGLFYTQGMPEDTKALSEGVFTDEEYIEQATFVLRERLRLYDYELSRFTGDFFFFYFSSLDLDSHTFWRALDKGHPLYSPELGKRHGGFLPWLYSQMDGVIEKAMERLSDDDLLIVMSDHGFTSFRRGFNLNTWLLENGYAALIDPRSQGEAEYFANTDWRRTRAYGLGINSLYLNIKGREFSGIVSPGDEARGLADELAARLREATDPETGERAIINVYKRDEVYSGECAKDAPDLIIGYNRHHRASWDTILGEYPRKVFVDNLDPWSGDHCMDATLIPGTFMSNRKIALPDPNLTDLAPTILAHFGAPKPPETTGRVIT
jgi:predicted AlkP superfamily phosphohydrolase/phosphomutase